MYWGKMWKKLYRYIRSSTDTGPTFYGYSEKSPVSVAFHDAHGDTEDLFLF